jgi:predicted transcriptional regulator
MHMPRVTLYIPDDLKARMDEVSEAVNWSAIAQQAFRDVVINLEADRK